MRISGLAAALVLTATSSVYAQERGEWTLRNGETVSRQCLILEEYGETTPIPQGCKVLLGGGGILYTRMADAQTSADMSRISADLKRCKSGLVDRRELLKRTIKEHEEIVFNLSNQCDRCAQALEKAPSRSSIWIALGTGFAAGVAAVATILVVN